MSEEVKIVIKDVSGNDQEYPMKNKLRVRLSDGTKQTYSKGEMLENIPVTLDFSNGNQTITTPDGYFVKSAVIEKPVTLVPESIAEGIEIAGIVGTHKGGSGDDEDGFNAFDENLKYFSYNIDADNKTIILTAYLDARKYADTGTYNIEIPDVIGGYKVVIDANGLVT